MMLILSLILFIIALILISQIKEGFFFKAFNCVLIAIFLVHSAFEVISQRIVGNSLNQAFIYHLATGLDGAGISEFKNLIIGGILFFLIALVFIFFIVNFMAKKLRGFTISSFNKILFSLALLTLSVAIHPTTLALIRLNFPNPPETPMLNFFHAPIVKSYPIQKPNLLWVYGESFERTYLNENVFPGLTPNLKNFESQSLSFTDIQQVSGASWTMAGIVASQCGIPLVTMGGGPNSLSNVTSFLPGAVCLADLLKKAGYKTIFIGGADANFAGKGAFLRNHGFDKIFDKKLILPFIEYPEYTTAWGIYDDSLFSFGEVEYKKLIDSKQPFAMFMLTLDTHPPYGHIARTCPSGYGDTKNPMLNSVHCSDYLLAKFLSRIRDIEGSKNTMMVVASDHLAMENTASEKLATAERRNLLMFNWPGYIKPSLNSRSDGTFSSGVTALDLMGFDIDGLGIGRSLIRAGATLFESHHDANAVVESWEPEIRKLWNLPLVPHKITIDPITNYVSFAGNSYKIPLIIDIAKNEQHPKLVFEDSGHELSDVFRGLSTETRSIWIDSCVRITIYLQRDLRDPSDLCMWDDHGTELVALHAPLEYSL